MTRPHRNDETIGVYLAITTPAHGKRKPDVEAAMNAGPEAQKDILKQYFQGAGWQTERVLHGMEETKDFYMSRSAQVKLPKWTNGRCVALGDAAWATFGVGTSLAIDGAYVLAGELTEVLNSSDIPKAIRRYEEVFRPMYNKMEDIPRGFPQLAMPQTRWGLAVRDSIFWVVSRTKVHRLFLGDDGDAEFVLPEYEWEEL